MYAGWEFLAGQGNLHFRPDHAALLHWALFPRYAGAARNAADLLGLHHHAGCCEEADFDEVRQRGSEVKLHLIRRESSENCTLGQLFVDDVPICFTCEDVVREQDNVPVKQWKIPGETAIPKGQYEVIVNHSARFKRELPLLLNVPGFSGIRIHAGNTAADTEGCILVGEKIGKDAVVESRLALTEVMALIKEAIAEGERVHIAIT